MTHATNSAPLERAKVTVEIAEGSDRARALRFIDKRAWEAHQCAARPLDGIVFAARIGTRVVGTLSVDFGSDERPFPLESIHRFDPALMPMPFDRRRIVQGGHWMVRVRGQNVSERLYAAVSEHLALRGIEWFFVEAKPHAYRRLLELRFTVVYIPGTLCLAHIPKDGMRYYSEDPKPRLYMVSVPSMRRALAEYWKP